MRTNKEETCKRGSRELGREEERENGQLRKEGYAKVIKIKEGKANEEQLDGRGEN